MVFEIENTKRRNVGFMNPPFLLGRALESLRVDLLFSYFELIMVKKSMTKLSKRWKYFPMLYFPKLFLREKMDSPGVFEQHNNAMKFFFLCIQWPSIYRTIERYFITCSKCGWETFRCTSHIFIHPNERFWVDLAVLS
jgi:hypothetical protein